MEIKLEDQQLKSLIGEAIFQSMDDQKRDALIKEAIYYLVTPKSSNYSGKMSSPLEDAFKQALYGITRDILADQLKNDPTVSDAVHGLLAEAVQRVFITGREETLRRVEIGIIDALKIGH